MDDLQNKKKKTLGDSAPAIQWRIDQWFPQLSSDLRSKLKLYHDELLKFNRTLNLIGVKTIPVADAIHFADSLLAVDAIAKKGPFPEIYDFGSGNGFPGLIYALQHPSTKVHLVEVDSRKAEFLKHMISVLQLSNAQVHVQTVESLPEKSIRFAMSRGFAPIPKALLLARKAIARDGIYYHLKSEEWVSEVGQIPTQLCSYWSPSLLEDYKLPIGEIRFSIVQTVKIAD